MFQSQAKAPKTILPLEELTWSINRDMSGSIPDGLVVLPALRILFGGGAGELDTVSIALQLRDVLWDTREGWKGGQGIPTKGIGKKY